MDSSTPPNLNFCLCSSKTQVQQLKRNVSNSVTKDSIMNAHKKTQLTHARINCALKDSSRDSLLLNNLKLTILASNASSSSIEVFKCLHTKDDSMIWTHLELYFNRFSVLKCIFCANNRCKSLNFRYLD